MSEPKLKMAPGSFSVGEAPAPGMARGAFLPRKERSELRKLADEHPGVWVGQNFPHKALAEGARGKFAKSATSERYETRVRPELDENGRLTGGFRLFVRKEPLSTEALVNAARMTLDDVTVSLECAREAIRRAVAELESLRGTHPASDLIDRAIHAWHDSLEALRVVL